MKPKKRRIIFIMLAVMFGYIGLHNFYIRRTDAGLIQLMCFCFFFWSIIAPAILWIYAIREVLTI